MLIYLAHPVSAPTPEGVAANVQRGKEWLKWAIRFMPSGYNFVAPWITLVEVLEECNPQDRERGMDMDFDVLKRCDALWLVGGRISAGMKLEKVVAECNGLRVVDLTKLGEAPSEAHAIDRCGLCSCPASWEIHPPDGSPLLSDLYCERHVPPTPFGFRAERV